MKKLSILIGIAVFCLSITNSVFAQTEIKGSGTSSTTHSLISTNSNSPVDTLMVVRDDGNVGIGTTKPNSKLEVNGLIHSTTGGIKFPDNSVQTTAATGGSVAYQNVITVAKSGGDYSTINGALAAMPPIPPPYGPGSAWHIRVMPGVYNETFTLPKYVHLKGAGKHTTFITGLVILSDTCVIEDFHLSSGLSCPGTSPTILHNIITNNVDNLIGIRITNGGDPWIKENEIIDCFGCGIHVDGFGTDPWIIANKIMRNGVGIKCENSSPTISNNYIFNNEGGVYLSGAEGTPAEPTIDDNQIGGLSTLGGGTGIYMTGYAEPRIIANDIYLGQYGIVIHSSTPQPSIIGNDINYNQDCGIYCAAVGSTKPVVIKSNHIHSNGNPPSGQPAGIWVTFSGVGQGGSPIITHNNIHNNPHDPTQPPNQMGWDINYSSCSVPISISLNVFDNITNPSSLNPPISPATGSYNVTSAGNTIGP